PDAADPRHDPGSQDGSRRLKATTDGRTDRESRERNEPEGENRRQQRTEREQKAGLRLSPRKQEDDERNRRIENGRAQRQVPQWQDRYGKGEGETDTWVK